MNRQDLFLRLRAIAGRKRVEEELDEELRFHIDMQARKLQAAGMDEAAARRRARVEFGGVEQVREQCREARGISFLSDAWRDIGYGLRMLRKSPGFAAIAILSLGIGIGANTAVFSLVNAVLYRTLAVHKPEQLVLMRWGASKGIGISSTWASGAGDGHGGWTVDVVSWPVFDALRKQSTTLQGLIGFAPLPRASVATRGQALLTGGMLVSGNFFETLGAAPLLGRVIQSDDDSSGGAFAAVISYRMWDRAFALNPSVIGQAVLVNKQPAVIVGVMPKDFAGVSPGGFYWAREIDFMLPMRAADQVYGRRTSDQPWFGGDLCWIQAMGRLRPDTGVAAASAELAAIVAGNLPEPARRALGSEVPRVVLKPGSRGLDWVGEAYGSPLLLLLAISGLTLLMACANLAGLLLARASARRKEILVRLAVGARRGRLIRQLLIEGALLAAGGAMAGVLFAWWGVEGLLGMLEAGAFPALIDVHPDLRVLGFMAAVSIATTFLFALAPAIRSTRVDLIDGLKAETPAAEGAGRPRLMQALVGLQVAVAVLLVAGSLAFGRSLTKLLTVPLGFNADRLLVFDIAPGTNGYDQARANQLYEQVREALSQSPGVTGASLAWSRLMTGAVSNGGVFPEGGTPGQRAAALFNFVGPDYFRVMEIPMMMGRGIGQRDLNSNDQVAVVNDAFARAYFGGGSPIGRRFRWTKDDPKTVEIVGVVRDARYARVRSEPEPTLYAPYTSSPFGWPRSMSYAVRTVMNPAETLANVRRVVRDIDPALPVIEPITMRGQISKSLFADRLYASLISLFGLLTLVLACVGLYGMISWSVAARTREIGVRVAMGASRGTVAGMVLKQVWGITTAGVMLGAMAMLAAGRLIESRLYGVKTSDPVSLGLGAAVIVAVALAAAIIPVRRAVRIDPVRALRYE